MVGMDDSTVGKVVPNTNSQVADDNTQQGNGAVDSLNPPVQRQSSSVEQGPVGGVAGSEVAPVVEVREYEVPAEVQEFVEKVEKENLELEKQVVHKGQPVVQPMVSVDEPKIVLPLSQLGITVSVKKKVSMSARWLAEWCVRIIKKFHGRVFYAPEKK